MDLGSPAIEVAIGLAFVFFLLSTIVSALTEGIAWWTKQRAEQLENGLFGLLGENRFAREVLRHALVQSDARKPQKKLWRRKAEKQKPSYVSARNFSLALIDVLAKHGEHSDDPLQNVKNGLAEIKGDAARAEEADGNDEDDEGLAALGQQLEALLGDPAITRLEGFRTAAEKWFDDAMDRVSGWYRRWSQWVTCVLAVAVAVFLNVNAIGIAEQLANDPTVRSAVVSRAEAAASKEKGDPGAAGKKAEEAVDTLGALELSVGWPKGFFHGFGWTMIFGWLITAIAVSLGAPFWFDALGKLAGLRTTGKKPKPEPEAATSG
ncbi:MAG TPA: hypothetical protein VJQ84_10100 [Solirubrobacterales bacterium]|nr:hypothetical protein [Solirubrobacterales bacterium]